MHLFAIINPIYQQITQYIDLKVNATLLSMILNDSIKLEQTIDNETLLRKAIIISDNISDECCVDPITDLINFINEHEEAFKLIDYPYQEFSSMNSAKVWSYEFASRYEDALDKCNDMEVIPVNVVSHEDEIAYRKRHSNKKAKLNAIYKIISNTNNAIAPISGIEVKNPINNLVFIRTHNAITNVGNIKHVRCINILKQFMKLIDVAEVDSNTQYAFMHTLLQLITSALLVDQTPECQTALIATQLLINDYLKSPHYIVAWICIMKSINNYTEELNNAQFPIEGYRINKSRTSVNNRISGLITEIAQLENTMGDIQQECTEHAYRETEYYVAIENLTKKINELEARTNEQSAQISQHLLAIAAQSGTISALNVLTEQNEMTFNTKCKETIDKWTNLVNVKSTTINTLQDKLMSQTNELILKNAELEQHSNKIETLEKMLYTATHDTGVDISDSLEVINTPLSTLDEPVETIDEPVIVVTPKIPVDNSYTSWMPWWST